MCDVNWCKVKKYEKLFFLCCILLGAVCFLTACGINPTQTVEDLIPIVSTILGIAGTVGETLLPAEASLIQKGVSLAVGGLQALLGALKSYDANKTGPGALSTLQAAFNAAHDNLTPLLTAAQVKNQTTAQKISGVVSGVIGVLGTLEAYIVSKHPPTATPEPPVAS